MKTSRRTCERKASFRSEAGATRFARSRGFQNQIPYVCNRCARWHLTTPNTHPADRARHAVYLAKREWTE